MRLMWFQFKKMLKRPALLYLVFAYLAIFGYLWIYASGLSDSLSRAFQTGLASGFLSLGLGLFTIAYMSRDQYKEAVLATAKKHSSYALSRLAALGLLTVLAIIIFGVLLAALGPLILNRQMVFGNVANLALVFLFELLVHLFFVFMTAVFTTLFKRVIYSLYALAALFFLPAVHPYLPAIAQYYLFWPSFYYHPTLSNRLMLLEAGMALIYIIIAMILYRAVNRK